MLEWKGAGPGHGGQPVRGEVAAVLPRLAFTRQRPGCPSAELVNGQVVGAVFRKAESVLAWSGCGFGDLLHRQQKTSSEKAWRQKAQGTKARHGLFLFWRECSR